MGTVAGLTIDDSTRIGLVIEAFGCEAISVTEVNRWCEELLRAHDLPELPDYVLELLEFDEKFAKVFRVVGFVPHSGLSQQETNALYGIALLRGVERLDWPVREEVARRALVAKPSVLERFRAEFPFISI